MDDGSGVTIALLARGLVDMHHAILFDGQLVAQDRRMPPRLRRALSRLSGHCLREGIEDFPASVHAVMERATRPLGEWGLTAFTGAFAWADVVLIDGDLGQPTPECFDIGAAGGETEILQEIHHERLRAAAGRFGPRGKDRAYRDIRELIVRRPCLPTPDLFGFLEDRLSAAQDIQSFYRPLPTSALHGRMLRPCAGCGAPLWPDGNTTAFPHGRCRIRDCRMRHPVCEPAREVEVEDLAEWRLATNAALAYWTGPGLAEIEVHDRLKQAGRKVELYPLSDAADIGLDGRDVGIDVKSYASAAVLGAKLARGIGNLALFRRKILCVPDARIRQDRNYLSTLRAIASQGEGRTLEFMTVGAVIAELAT